MTAAGMEAAMDQELAPVTENYRESPGKWNKCRLAIALPTLLTV
jgi:hypothetical protein